MNTSNGHSHNIGRDDPGAKLPFAVPPQVLPASPDPSGPVPRRVPWRALRFLVALLAIVPLLAMDVLFLLGLLSPWGLVFPSATIGWFLGYCAGSAVESAATARAKAATR